MIEFLTVEVIANFFAVLTAILVFLTYKNTINRIRWLEEKVQHLLIENTKNAFNIEAYYKPALTFLQNHADDFRAISGVLAEKNAKQFTKKEVKIGRKAMKAIIEAKATPKKRGRPAGWKKA